MWLINYRNAPKQVVYAVKLVWLGLLLDLPLSYFHSIRINGVFSFSVDYIYITLLAIAVFVSINILDGKNWARFAQLTLALISWALNIYDFNEFLQQGMPEQMINVTDMLCDIPILYFLFTRPGKDWFKKNL